MYMRIVLAGFLAVSLLTGVELSSQQQSEKLRKEEIDNYFDKWLNQDVVYIITDEERAVFKNLTSPEERESFLEQFWRRRDPDPETAINEFREEHYRRIAYANDHYSIGAPGWKTDRGRVYIIHGPPDSTEHHDQGQQYYRPMTEGGGVTTTYAWQVWFYRHLPGIGDGVEIEFVDKTMSGHYVLARDEMDKDAMLWVPGLGLTESERLGGTYGKAERIGTRTLANEATRRVGNPLKIFTQKDDLFARLRRYTKLQAAPDIKFKDLEAIVDIQLYYNKLPFTVRHDLIRISPNDYLVPVTFYFQNEEFNYKEAGSIKQATLSVYGRVENMLKQRVYHFDDTVTLTLSNEEMGQTPHSVYQRNIPLKPGRYKLVAIVKDVDSQKIGTLERGLYIPGDENETELEISPIILADRVQPAGREEFINDPFVLSTVKVVPSANNKFKRGDPLGFYFEIYNVMADQQTLEPSLALDLKVTRDGQDVPLPFKDLERLLHPYSDRFFAASMLSTQPLEPGRYTLTLSVTDRVANLTEQQTINFEIL